MPTQDTPTNNSLTLDPPSDPPLGGSTSAPAEARARLVRRGPDARGANSLREAWTAAAMLNGIGNGPGDEPATLLLHVDELGEFTPRRLVHPVAHDQLVRLTAAVKEVATVQSATPSDLLLPTTGAERARSWKLLHRSHLLCHEGCIHCGAGQRRVAKDKYRPARSLPRRERTPPDSCSPGTGPQHAITEGICTSISSATVRRLLAEDALKPWQYQSWILAVQSTKGHLTVITEAV